ncbi:MAG: hypothetical protein H7145_01020 [Akkermansiaceae bacterium]|nr:hypothetical protein [Armatimonadota bacterium]
MNRKQFLGAAGVLLAGTVTGCGGGGNDNENDNVSIDNPGGSSSDDLSRLALEPPHDRAAYINDDTDFLLSWPSAAEAPRSAQVRLYRFLEARGGESREDRFEESFITGNNNGSWVVRSRNFLATGGVYYLDVSTALNRKRSAFIVEDRRSVNLPVGQDTLTRAVDINNNGGTGSLNNLTLRYNGDSIGPVGIAPTSSFVLQFPSESAAPARMTVRLRRYKERRGEEGPSGNEQEIELLHDAGSNVWTIRRRDNFPLERGATYILEFLVDGERQRNYPFLTEG